MDPIVSTADSGGSVSPENRLTRALLPGPAAGTAPRSGPCGTAARVYLCCQDGTVHTELGTAITYSSTCPCSAALARELLRERFVERFGNLEKLTVAETLGWLDSEEGILPVPHSQRSRADVLVEIDSVPSAPTPLELIDIVERALGTPSRPLSSA